MHYHIVIAAEQEETVRSVCTILRVLSLSCTITLTTTAGEAMIDYLQEHKPHLLILGFSHAAASRLTHLARNACPALRVLWLAEGTDTLPEADVSLPEPVTALRLINSIFLALVRKGPVLAPAA